LQTLSPLRGGFCALLFGLPIKAEKSVAAGNADRRPGDVVPICE
jgi:hypothetical protein